MRQSVPGLLPLFRSEDQVRLLAALALDPRRSWTVEELTAAIGAPRPSVHRELQRAVTAGFVDRDATRRPHAFRVATDSPTYRPLRELLELTVGLESELRALLDADPKVDAAAIHGSWAAGRAGVDSDVDVVVIGRLDLTELRRAVRAIGRRIGRRVDVTAFSPDEFRTRQERGDGFVKKLLDGPRIVLVDSGNWLSE
jgi:predicted nucleotidyltransferase